MTQSLLYTAVFKSTLTDQKRVQELGSELIRCHNMFGEITNRLNSYSKWNSEYDRLYPNDTTDNADPDGTYMRYIRGQMNIILNMMNDIGASRELILYAGDECNVMAKIKGTNDTIEFFIKQVDC